MSLFGDIAGLVGAENAEDAQFAASQQQAAALEKGYQRAVGEYRPYADFGAGGMGLLSRLYGLNGQPADMSAFTASPDYQFRLGEGQRAIESSAAARGGLFSGAAGKALSDYNQNTAASEFNNYVSRLFGITGVGQQAANGIANAATGNATSMANVYGTMGQNQANAQISQANAIGGMADSAFGAFEAGSEGEGGFDMQQAAMMFFGG